MPLVLKGGGPATTARTVIRLCRDRLDTRKQVDFFTTELRRGRALLVVGKPAAPHSQNLTQHYDRPALLLRYEGVFQLDSLAKKRAAVCKISRSMRRRLTSLRHC
jgi:hypothetical protein